MVKVIVSFWESEGYGHYTHTEKEITSQDRKIREICARLGIDCPEDGIHKIANNNSIFQLLSVPVS
jgi:hypothetical protein